DRQGQAHRRKAEPGRQPQGDGGDVSGPSKEYAAIRRAVRERQAVTFVHNRKRRDVYPVILGYGSDGSEALMAYQFVGQPSPGNTLPGWPCFHLEDIRDVTSRKGGWL